LKSNILISICARGGSKGIPGKNIKKINEIPLIAYTINTAKAFSKKYNTIISISTDDLEIKKTAENFGIKSNYKRPEHLATDSAGKIDVIRDLINYEEKKNGIKFDIILDLDVTSPLRTIDDLENAYITFMSDENALTLFSVNISNRSPYFNMVEKNEFGYYQLSKKFDTTILTRQSAPMVYDLNASFYFYRRNYFDLDLKTPITNKSIIFEMEHICFDLDHPHDFDYLEYLLSNNKLPFQI
jgi:CMP-N,N'-diacetyllegionaminic acid synthase